MTGDARITMTRGAAAMLAAGLLLAGAGAAYLGLRSRPTAGEPSATTPAGTAGGARRAATPPPGDTATGAVEGLLPDVEVTLDEAAVERAGIVVAPVARRSAGLDLRLPGVVEPNAYRQVVVTPLVGGRVTRVQAELGDRVRRGETMAQIYSPPLAEAQTRYVAARAMLDAHDRELQRTERLVEIGAASRQELERIHAEHAAQTAALQTARAQLQLLGVSATTIEALDSGRSVDASSSVPAPLDGVVTKRAANVGLNIEASTELFTVTDLSTVWIVADVYERDFSRVRVGNEVMVTTQAYPELALPGRISYIDSQVNAGTRTARLRVEVPNPRGELRLGMYADVVVTGAARTPVPMVPRSAVQNIGDRTVVYLASAEKPATFVEREVSLGAATGEHVEVTAGVRPGDLVVSGGSFSIRAERERRGLRSARAAASSGAAAHGSQDVQTARVVVNEKGFDPGKLALRAGVPARLTFVRSTEATCGTEVVFPSLDIKRALPLKEPVDVEFTPAATGEISFACGMNMLKGAIVVE